MSERLFAQQGKEKQSRLITYHLRQRAQDSYSPLPALLPLESKEYDQTGHILAQMEREKSASLVTVTAWLLQNKQLIGCHVVQWKRLVIKLMIIFSFLIKQKLICDWD